MLQYMQRESHCLGRLLGDLLGVRRIIVMGRGKVHGTTQHNVDSQMEYIYMYVKSCEERLTVLGASLEPWLE